MLLEAINFAASYVLTPRRVAGEIRSSVNLWARARRCARDWAGHEAHCHAFILKAIKTLPRRRVAVVLGSGLLRDVPIEALSKAFDEVRLYDLQHLASVRAWAFLKGLRNLTYVSQDLSGYAALKADSSREPQPLAFLHDMTGLDLVVSANLLSQIGVGIGRLAKMEGMPDETVLRLIRAHVEGLAALPGRTCLLTDVSYDIIDKSSEVLERDDLMKGVALPAAEAEWAWTVAPYGELDPGYKAVHRVVAITLPPAAPVRSLP